MKILYDETIFKLQTFGGISRYFSELVNYSESNFESVLGFKYTNNQNLLENKIKFGIEKFPMKRKSGDKLKFPGSRTFFNYIDLFINVKYKNAEKINIEIFKKLMNEGKFDIFHPTYYDSYFLELIKNKPFVLTVYDMIHELYPEYYPVEDSTAYHKFKLMEKATHIISISENTKNDIIKIYGINEKKITVIPLATSIQTKPLDLKNGPCNVTLPEKYILFTGNRYGYKNFYFFINAITPILKQWNNLKIVCTGNVFSNEEIKFFKEKGLDGKFFHFFSDDNLLAHLYRNAMFFVFPSIYEGFGIPILEAFSCECPVLLSNSSSFPEVAGNAACYFEPKDIMDLREKILYLLENTKIRMELVKNGKSQLEKFSWEKTISKTKEIYKKIY